jgi:hypothetical protein
LTHGKERERAKMMMKEEDVAQEMSYLKKIIYDNFSFKKGLIYKG